MEIQFTKPAWRDFKKLPTEHQNRVMAALDKFARTGLGDVVPVQTFPGVLRLKLSGSFPRILFRRLEGDLLEVVRILPRGQAY